MKLAVCDDEVTLINRLTDTLTEEFQDVKDLEIDEYTSGEDLLKACIQNDEEYDAIFLDVYMEKLTGFDVAEVLVSSHNDARVIFITSNSDLVYECFDYEPFYFIRKDRYEEQTSRAVQKLRKVMKQDRIFKIAGRDGVKTFSLKNIYFFESDKHNVLVHTTKYDEIVRRNISDIAKEFENDDFIRIHRKYVVNLKYIKRIDVILDEVTLTNEVRLEMSRYQKEEIVQAHLMYLRGMRNV